MAKSARRAWHIHGQRFTEKKFLPYATAIGQVALAWNDLHEVLSELFCTLYGGSWIAKPLAIWHSAKFDRPKRDMLRGMLVHWTNEEKQRRPKAQADITWLLDRATELEEARNNAVHSPLLLIAGGGIVEAARARGLQVPDVISHTLYNNPRALRMALKDLLFEFRWCRAAVLVLRDYASRLDHALTHDGAPWPGRPKLPNRGQKSAHQGQHRQRGSAPRARPSRSSRA